VKPHLRDARIEELKKHIALAVHKRGARNWEELDAGRKTVAALARRYRFGPLLATKSVKVAEDGTRKCVFRTLTGETIETVLVRNRQARTLCVSSQAGCALGCAFCATARVGLLRNLTAGEITESVLLSERAACERVTDIVFMGQGEPLCNYDAVMEACTILNHDLGPCISKKRISISTSGLVPQVLRYTDEARPWRLYLSLHSAIQATRERIMPIARRHRLPELLDAMRAFQTRRGVPWLTLQYVAIPGVNMDQRHVDALAQELRHLRYILNVIPYNDVGAGFRPPSWAEVKEFTTRLCALKRPVKTRYSAGKREGMGCGQLSAELVATPAAAGHVAAPPGTFTG